MGKEIIEVYFTESKKIILYEHYNKNDTISKGSSDSYLIENHKYVATKAHYNNGFKNKQILGKVDTIDEKKLERFFDESRYETTEDKREILRKIVEINNFDIERTWIIVDIFTKKITGKKIEFPYDFIMENYDYKKYTHGSSYVIPLTIYSNTQKKQWGDIKYSAYIPDNVYEALQTLPKYEDRPSSKVIESTLISDIKSQLDKYIQKLTYYLSELKGMEKSEKVIVINYKSGIINSRDDLNFGFTGEKVNIGYSFFIAYRYKDGIFKTTDKYYVTSRVDKGERIETLTNEGSYNRYSIMKDSLTNCSIIQWTQERENFLTLIQSKFLTLKDNLDNFLKDLNNEKLDLLIENKNSQLFLK